MTNFYADFDLINLCQNENGRGPYLIRQDGVPPGSMTVQEDRFLLNKGGTWMINFKLATLPEEAKQEYVFNSIEEVQAVVRSLRGKPVVDDTLPPDLSREALLQQFEAATSKLLQQVRDAKGAKLSTVMPGE